MLKSLHSGQFWTFILLFFFISTFDHGWHSGEVKNSTEITKHIYTFCESSSVISAMNEIQQSPLAMATGIAKEKEISRAKKKKHTKHVTSYLMCLG